MDIFQLEGTRKETFGRRDARRMRNEGNVPAVIYGHGENVMVSLQERDLQKLLITPHVYLIDLSVDGKVEKVILKEVQYHPVTDRPLHIDFYRYTEDDPIVIAIPVKLEGHAQGVRAGGKLVAGTRRVKVKGLAADLPNVLTIDVTDMRIGQTLLVGDLSFDKLEVVDTKTVAVAKIATQRGAAASTEEETAAEGEETPADGEEAPASEE